MDWTNLRLPNLEGSDKPRNHKVFSCVVISFCQNSGGCVYPLMRVEETPGRTGRTSKRNQCKEAAINTRPRPECMFHVSLLRASMFYTTRISRNFRQNKRNLMVRHISVTWFGQNPGDVSHGELPSRLDTVAF